MSPSFLTRKADLQASCEYRPRVHRTLKPNAICLVRLAGTVKYLENAECIEFRLVIALSDKDE
jgi:hypothetical protein